MGRDKALVRFEGTRLVDRVHDRLSEVADPILFATGTVGRLGPLPGPEVADPSPGGGPLAGIVAGLDASPHGLVAVVAVDMPYLSAALFRLLSGSWDGEDVVVPVDEHGPQVLHALYAKRCLPVLRAADDAGGRGPRDLLTELNVRYIGEESWRAADPTGRFAYNVNRPEDLAGA